LEKQAEITAKYAALQLEMDERARRLWAATEARAVGYGGLSVVYRATGLSRTTIRQGLVELETEPAADAAERVRRVRREGAGRPRVIELDPRITLALEALVDPATRGDPESPLRWTCKGTRVLARELQRQGFTISHATVAQLLVDAGYSLQAPSKVSEGRSHRDRNAQFEHIARRTGEFLAAEQPVISVDAKKKEKVGDFKNGGREYQPGGQPERVRTHDFVDKELGKALPYGVYDLNANQGWVSVGVDHDTSAFAVATIEQWWRQMGRRRYPHATRLLVTADSGGSNGNRTRLWKVELQRLANAVGLAVSVCHFPPGTSKWNKIEHRMFCHITMNWRGRPLVSREVIVNLIANTSTTKGLSINAALDLREYPKGIKVTDEELAAVRLQNDAFHGDWNYTIVPARAH